VVAVWEKLFALTSPRPGGIEGRDGLPPPLPRGERPQATAAIAGIDIALWDIKGKAADLPVYCLLGGENRPIFTYATGGYHRPDASDADYGRELAQFIELGYRAVKLKTGAGTVAAEAARIDAVRRAIGDDPLLMLDLNAAYDLPDCIEFAHAVQPHRIFWLEEPLHWYLQPADFARSPAHGVVPVRRRDTTHHLRFPEGPRVRRLAGGAKRVRTLGPALAKGTTGCCRREVSERPAESRNQSSGPLARR
jgi:D-galactarolactone cycloisomerase